MTKVIVLFLFCKIYLLSQYVYCYAFYKSNGIYFNGGIIMSKEEIIEKLSCTDCSVYNCRTRTKQFPSFCLTTKNNDNFNIDEQIKKTSAHLKGDNADAVVAKASAQVEGLFYCQKTRVEEILEFAKRINAKKIGIATCAGLIEEAKIFARILKIHGFECYSAMCKVGSVDKTTIGLNENEKVRPDNFEAMCNPILQAEILNAQETDLNVLIGLCVGHDSLFTKYAKAYNTTLVTKDRVTGHNPVAALYVSHSYYKRLMEADKKD